MKGIVGIAIVLFITVAPFAVYGSPTGLFMSPTGSLPTSHHSAAGGRQMAESSQTGTESNLTWMYIFFHSNLLPGIGLNSHVTAGQLIGYADVLNAHDFDNALEVFSNFPSNMSGGSYSQTTTTGTVNYTPELDSPFNHMSPAVLQQFASYGITPSNMITPKAVRDASPCDFSQPSTQANWEVLNKSSSPVTSTNQSSSSDFVVSAPVDLSQIQEISKFRSCAGHDYSGLDVQGINETDRSMKHYLAPLPAFANSTDEVKLFAPFNGTIMQDVPEHSPRGNQVWITPDASYTPTSTGSTTFSASSTSLTTSVSTSAATSSAASSSTATTSSTSSAPTTAQSTTSTTELVATTTSSIVTSSFLPTSTSAVSSQPTTTSTVTTPATTSQSTGGVPEFPSQPLAAAAFVAVIVTTYLLARRTQGKGPRLRPQSRT